MSAIFLLIVLAALGAAMVTFSTAQHATSAQDIQGSRAYQAARAGIEWGVFQVLRGSPTPPVCNASTPLTLGGTLSGFAVTVECAVFPASGAFNENGTSSQVFRITSTAVIGAEGSVARVERQLQVTVEYPPPP
ncbi:hypothetical protein [Noviherbaspirillum sp.]|uniref:hypothetical protein n=1 Tax=Noviherbaspirillum sp. TaxID=1926288 RepID=UPI002B45CB58|nr:hypothetical protein [Noviherbaspirillum sp.]HJV83170.1 hypothetical protein [Noviherbaspirillum sp.]